MNCPFSRLDPIIVRDNRPDSLWFPAFFYGMKNGKIHVYCEDNEGETWDMAAPLGGNMYRIGTTDEPYGLFEGEGNEGD